MRKIFAVLVMTVICVVCVFSVDAFAAMSDGDFLQLCVSGTVQEVEAAIKSGANINARDEYGETPLMLAARSNRNPGVISVLLQNGADASITDNEGMSAVDYASVNTRLRNTDVYQQLVEASNIEKMRNDTVVNTSTSSNANTSIPEVTLVDLFVSSEDYVGREVKIRGEFLFVYTGDKSFEFSQGNHSLWVYYENLSPDEQRLILEAERRSSFEVIGVVRRARSGENLEIVATSVRKQQLISANDVETEIVEDTPVWTEQVTPSNANVSIPEITYIDMLISPEDYIGREVKMLGEFLFVYTGDKSFEFSQGNHSLWVYYENLSPDEQRLILEAERRSSFEVIGVVRRARSGENLEIVATSVRKL